MKNILKKFINFVIPFAEILYLPLLVISGLVMWLYRSTGSKRLKLSTKILRKIGIFPIRDHYYEPLFNDAHLSKNLKNPRELPGIDLNEEGQLKFLRNLIYQIEFSNFVETSRYGFGNFIPSNNVVPGSKPNSSAGASPLSYLLQPDPAR